MAKRPSFNPGARATPAIGRPLPDVDVNPDTNPATAAFAAGAAVKTEPMGHSGISEPLKPSKPPIPQLEKPRFSLLTSDVALIDGLASEFRRATGQEVTPSRVVRAALRQFADHPDRLALIAAVEELKPGRKPRV
ncbi:MAG: hypothetical protein F8N15_01255 [Methanobacterium sp.]|nr:hypothetical protein [Methanobacterium sp.]